MTGQQVRQVVVAGHGMAGARFAAELTARTSDIAVRILGDEPRGGYNRVLLTTMLAGGCHSGDLFLDDPAALAARGITVTDRAPVTAIDPALHRVQCGDGSEVRYDRLVLATGSIPVVPAIDGLRCGGDQLLPGCHTFRTLADCHALLAEARHARRAVVAGGGVLGLETAVALAGLGLDVQVVHRGRALMEAQLDPDASAVLHRVLADMGIGCHLGSAPLAVLGDDRVTGVVLNDSRRLDCDLLVVACGTMPDTALATAAGLATDRGVLVDDAMRSVSDPHVLAIGDCAQHRGQVYGIAAPALQQAAVAAATVAASAAPPLSYPGSPVVTRLKASGIELASMGDVAPEPHDAGGREVVKLIDPVRGVYFKLVVTHGKLTGAVIVGDADAAAAATVAHDQQSILPPDRLRLLLGTGAESSSPADLPAAAPVCHCNAVTAGEIRSCASRGARTVAAVARETLATTGCGTCRPAVAALLAASTAAPATGGAPAMAGAALAMDN
jgi:assimilatory nitrate reductase electron transfer subunit